MIRRYSTSKKFFPIFIILICSIWITAGCARNAYIAQDNLAMTQMEYSLSAMPRESNFAQDEPTLAQASGTVAAGIQRKVIARASIELVVQDVPTTVDALNQLVDEVGGYVADTNLYKRGYNNDERVRGSIRLRVPADLVDDVLAQLEEMALDVNSKSITREDVTDQYSDVQAQLRNLEAAETELRALLAEVRAKPDAKPSDILAVYHSLTEIRGQIDQVQGRKNMLNNLIDLATIDIELTPDAADRPIVAEGWSPGAVVQEALRTLVETLELLGDIAIWVVLYVLPVLILLLLPLAIVFMIMRALMRRRSAKKKQNDNA